MFIWDLPPLTPLAPELSSSPRRARTQGLPAAAKPVGKRRMGDQVDVMAVSVAPLRRERTIGVVIKGAMSGWRRQRRTDESGERQASSTPRMTASPGTEAEVGSYFRGIPGSRGSTYADEGGILDVVPPSAAPRSIIAADLPAPPRDNGAPFASPAS